MSKLPEDLIINILVRLPVKSILRLRCVCKQWLKLISDHYFIKLHFNIATENEIENVRLMVSGENMYSMNFDSIFLKVNRSKKLFHEVIVEIDYPFKSSDRVMAVVGSCNGLLCIASSEETFCIWNPCTQMYKEIPSFPTEIHSHQNLCGIQFGFGYDFHNEEYKFVVILDIGGDRSIAKVYTEGTNTWKADQLIPYSFTLENMNMSGVIASETLHWIANHCSGSETRSLVLSFSISDETFGELPLPEKVNDPLCIGVLGGHFCIMNCGVNMFEIDVWVMKDYGVDSSWSKLLMIPLPTTMPSLSMVGVKLLHSFKNGEILLWRDNTTLLLYHPKYNESRIVMIHGIPEGLHDVMTFVGSLYSVNS